MASLADLLVRVGIDSSGWAKDLKGLSDDMKSFDKELKSVERSLAGFEKVGARLSEVGAGLTAGLTLPLAGVAVAGTTIAAKLEQVDIAFRNLLGSGEKAKSMLEALKAFAASTPFEFPDLVESAKRMLAMGFEAGKLIPTLRIIGDAVAGIGGGSAEINRVTLALGQMSAKGKVSAQEMNQLAELGIPAWKFLADQIGVKIPEAMKLAEKGAIEASVAVPAILDGMNKKFGGMMQQQSQTMIGVWSNAKDQITFILGDIGAALAPAAKSALDALLPVLNVVKMLVHEFTQLPVPVQSTAIAFGGLVVAAGPVMYALGTMMQAVPAISAMLTVLSGVSLAGLIVALKVAGVAAIALGVAFAAWKFQDVIPGIIVMKAAVSAIADATMFWIEQIRKIPGVGAIIDKMSGAVKGAKDQFDKATSAVTGLTKGNAALGTTTKDLAALQEKYAKMLGGTTKETKEATEHNKKYRQVNEELAAMLRILQSEHNKNVDAIAAYKLKVAQGRVEVVDFNIVLKDLVRIVGQVDSVIGDVAKITLPKLIADMHQLTPPTNTFKDALKTLGITGSADLKKVAEEAAKARDIVLGSNLATDFEKKTAIYRALKAQVEAAVQMGKDVPKETTDALAKMEAEINTGKGKDVVTASKGMFTQVSTIITNFAQDAAKILFDGDMSWGEKVKAMWGKLKESLVSTFIEPATKALTDFITGVLTDLISGKGFGGVLGQIQTIGRELKDVFGAGGVAAPTPTPTTAPGVGGAGGGIGSSVGSAASGLSGWISAISGAVTAISSVVQAFQLHGIGNDTGKIEENTRGILADVGNLRTDEWEREGHLMLKLDDIWGTVGAGFGNAFTRAGELYDVIDLTTNAYLARIATAVEMPMAAAGGAGGVTVNIYNPNFTNQAGIDAAIGQIKRSL